MTFLNPLLLFGLAAAAIPLIIHLFNFRRPRRVDFSSLAFLQELKKSTMQRVRIKQWLLLALRTLTILFLVLAFARPTLTGRLAGSLGGRGRTSTAIVLDNSRSMLLRDGSGAYLEQARTIAATLLEEMESGDEVYLVPTVSRTPQSPAFQNAAGARQALLGIEAEEGEMSLVHTVSQAEQLLEQSANPNREIYVLADLQASTFADSLGGSGTGNTPVYLVPIGNQDHDNLAITGVEVLSRILSVGQVVRLEVQLANFGERSADDLVVSLYLAGDRVSRATTTIGPGETVRVPIALTPRESGWLGGQVEIDDDDFTDDDAFHFSLFIPEERNILLVAGPTATTRFIEIALSSNVTGSGVRFNVTRISESSLAQAQLGSYDTVVLTGITDLTSGESAAITAYVQDGGGLLIFPAENPVVPDYNALLAELGGGRVDGVVAQTSGAASLAGFDRVDVEHPLFEGMFEEVEPGGAARIEQPDIYRLLTYQEGQGAEQTLIRLSDDHSFLQEIRHGLGSALLFAVAPDQTWSDFPVRGLFIPLLYRSIYYLSAGASVSGEQFVSGAPAQFRLTGVSSDLNVTVESETGDSYVPDLRRTAGGVVATIGAGYLQSGIYDVKAGGDIIRKVAVNVSAGESDVAMLSPDDARERLSGALDTTVSELDLSGTDTAEIRSHLREARTGMELWNVFMLLALFTMLAEMIVEKKWRPEAA